MRLVNTDYNLDIMLEENLVNIISIENPELFTRVVSDLSIQYETGDGHFLLSDQNKELRLDKVADYIFNPLDVDMNCKRFYMKFLQVLQEVSREYLYEDYLKLNSYAYQYIEKLTAELPYMVTYDTEIAETALYKLYNVRIEDESDGLVKRLSYYVQLSQQLMNLKVIFMVNLKDFISSDELLELYKEFHYNKIQLVIIEARKSETLSGEKGVIIDRNQCIITY
jgi:CRISPR-associated protein Csn2